MKNLKTKILVLIIILLMIIVGILGIVLIKKTEVSKNILTKEEHYAEQLELMEAYYLIYFKNINIKEKEEYKPIKVTLGQLERYGFPTEDFVNYETKEPCDKAYSYAYRTVENNKYKVKVFYKCGNTSNYKLTTTTKNTSKAN